MRLASLLHSSALITSAAVCYEQGAAPDVSKLVEVQFGRLVVRDDSAALPFRWHAAGPGGGLFPALGADLTLTALGEDATVLRLAGSYRAPSGRAAAVLDRAVLQRAAAVTIQAFVRCVANDIVHAADAPAPGGKAMGIVPWQPPAPETP